MPSDADICPYCGHDHRLGLVGDVVQPAVSGGMKILFYILSLIVPLVGFIIGAVYYSKPDAESKHVGKVCFALAIVAIVIAAILVALIYVMTFGIDYGGVVQPGATMRKEMGAGGIKLTITAITRDVIWTDVTILLQEPNGNTVSWTPHSTDLDGGGFVMKSFAPVEFGGVGQVWCNVSDLAGNECINSGDYFTLTTGSSSSFSASTTYTVTIMYEPTYSSICNLSFTG